MLTIKDPILTSDLDQQDDQKYHLYEMEYHLKSFREALKEAEYHVSRFGYHLSEIKEISNV